ncbi:hypothetical protein DAEQUDRAFT_147094 [Daedalea quercina L-15889]|uniref:GST N-terminal domain-containing protein n=1 Tax=Daedalea quercina L-15889 TaxID=1314783 RepID=A0A165KNB9_9APHY|nr:hypothetical protein DAEQUDRAFT_147094 [Daedalea quercina L-15889]
MPEHIFLYMNKISGYCHRVQLALEEANAEYTAYEINLYDMPSWFKLEVNPAGKVPAIAYGGSQTLPDVPQPDSVKLAESLVLVEFVADLYPDSGLLPQCPVLRAKARFFVNAVCSELLSAWDDFFRHGHSMDAFLLQLERVQGLMPPDGGFAIGPFSTADAVIAPWLGRMHIALENEVGGYPVGEGKKALEELALPRFARLRRYWEGVRTRSSFRNTFDEEYVTKAYKVHYGNLRQKK